MRISHRNSKHFTSKRKRAQLFMQASVIAILVLIGIFFFQINSYGPTLLPDSISPYTSPKTQTPAQKSNITPPVKIYDVKLRNVNADLEIYNLHAQKSWQNKLNDPKIYFETIEGNIKLNNGKKNLKLNAKNAIYDNKKQKLRLFDNLHLNWANLYHLYSNNLHIDIRQRILYIDSPVYVSFPKGYINAGKATIMQSGEHVIFDRKVRVHFKTNDKKI